MKLNPVNFPHVFKKDNKFNQETKTKNPDLNSYNNFSYDKSFYIGFCGNSDESFDLKLEKSLKKPDNVLYDFLNNELSKKVREKR